VLTEVAVSLCGMRVESIQVKQRHAHSYTH